MKKWQLDNIGNTLTKKQFPAVFKTAWQSVATFEVAAQGFRHAGLFLLDFNGIDKTKFEPSAVANPSRSPSHNRVPVTIATPTTEIETTVTVSPIANVGSLSTVEPVIKPTVAAQTNLIVAPTTTIEPEHPLFCYFCRCASCYC